MQLHMTTHDPLDVLSNVTLCTMIMLRLLADQEDNSSQNICAEDIGLDIFKPSLIFGVSSSIMMYARSFIWPI